MNALLSKTLLLYLFFSILTAQYQDGLFSNSYYSNIQYAKNKNINWVIAFNKKAHIPFNNEVIAPKGVQFDIIFNPDQVELNELASLLKGSIFEYSKIEEGQIRCVMFNLDGSAMSQSQLNNIASISFNQASNYYGLSKIEVSNMIVAGEYGENVTSYYESPSYILSFENLKPKLTRIYVDGENVFQDSIYIFLDVSEFSNINISIFDIFNTAKKEIIDKDMSVGTYSFGVDKYDGSQEEFLEGSYVAKLFVNSSILDSVNIIHKKQTYNLIND